MKMKYQLTCPKCKHEFAYDNGHIDSKITNLRCEITRIKEQITEYKKLPYYEQMQRKDWHRRAAHKVASMQRELSELNAFRKIANQEKRKTIDQVFKNLVKEQIGTEAYKDLMKKAEAECEAYNISDTMRHEYTKANYKTAVTSINKL